MKKDWITSGSAQICEIVIRSRDPNQGPHSPGERDAIDGRQLAPNPWRLVSSEDNERQRQLFFGNEKKATSSKTVLFIVLCGRSVHDCSVKNRCSIFKRSK